MDICRFRNKAILQDILIDVKYIPMKKRANHSSNQSVLQ